jgi:hypothetical protein
MSSRRRGREIRRAADYTVVWFAMLQRARRCGDGRLSDRARAELKRLGVRVRFDGGNLGDDTQASAPVMRP